MNVRRLPRSEWRRLAETGVNLQQWLTFPEDSSHVLVVEHDGDIAATWTAVPVMHLEGFWVAPDHRGKSGALRRLIAGMRDELGSLGLTTALTIAETPDIERLLGHVGAAPLPGRLYLVPVRQEATVKCL